MSKVKIEIAVFLERNGVLLQANGRELTVSGWKPKLNGRKSPESDRKPKLNGRKSLMSGRKQSDPSVKSNL